MNDTLWTTSDTPLAAFAVVVGKLKLVSVDAVGEGTRFNYTFSDPARVGPTMRNRYVLRESVCARDFEEARKTLVLAVNNAKGRSR